MNGYLKAEIKSARMSGKLEKASMVYEKNYELLDKKPSINDVTLLGNQTFEDLGDHILTNSEILNLYKTVKGM